MFSGATQTQIVAISTDLGCKIPDRVVTTPAFIR
jgi:hypothetical protein